MRQILSRLEKLRRVKLWAQDSYAAESNMGEGEGRKLLVTYLWCAMHQTSFSA
jgi:hypothetical protein